MVLTLSRERPLNSGRVAVGVRKTGAGPDRFAFNIRIGRQDHHTAVTGARCQPSAANTDERMGRGQYRFPTHFRKRRGNGWGTADCRSGAGKRCQVGNGRRGLRWATGKNSAGSHAFLTKTNVRSRMKTDMRTPFSRQGGRTRKVRRLSFGKVDRGRERGSEGARD